MAKKRRTAAQIRATKKLVAMNKKRARINAGRSSHRKVKKAAVRKTQPKLTVTQGMRLYKLGRKKALVAIKGNRKHLSIVTGSAVKKMRRKAS